MDVVRVNITHFSTRRTRNYVAICGTQANGIKPVRCCTVQIKEGAAIALQKQGMARLPGAATAGTLEQYKVLNI